MKKSIIIKFLHLNILTFCTVVFTQLIVISQAIKPQISSIDFSQMPSGCSYTLDDWKGNLLAWTNPFLPYSKYLIMEIDGESKEISITIKNDEYISAFDGKYLIEISTPQWRQIPPELAIAKATLKVINTHAQTETKIIVRASEGC